MRYLAVIACLVTGACASAGPQSEASPLPTNAISPPTSVADGDPASAAPMLRALEQRWEVVRIDTLAFPDKQAFVHFQKEGFFSHEAGCGGGHPAFYTATGEGALSTTRREAVVVGKCADRGAAALERSLAKFMDKASGWSMPDAKTLVLTASDGKVAHLRLPGGPVPALEGAWQVVSIGGKAWSGPKPATVSMSYNWIGAGAGCNGGGASWTLPGPGRLRLGDFSVTDMLCDEELMRAETDLFGAVMQATGYRIDGERVLLTGPRDIVLAR